MPTIKNLPKTEETKVFKAFKNQSLKHFKKVWHIYWIQNDIA